MMSHNAVRKGSLFNCNKGLFDFIDYFLCTFETCVFKLPVCFAS